jgi:large subunit ribosomal protein L4
MPTGSSRSSASVSRPPAAHALTRRPPPPSLQGTASTLTRGEVRGGGRKPYKQKGTGNARRGSKRSPLMPGGGISFGPKPRDWSISMNKKERRLALATALQSAAADALVVSDFAADYAEISTSALLAKLRGLGVDPEAEKVLLVLTAPSEALYLSARNVPKLAINPASALQVYDVLAADRVLVEAGALAFIQEFYGDDEAVEAEEVAQSELAN